MWAPENRGGEIFLLRSGRHGQLGIRVGRRYGVRAVGCRSNLSFGDAGSLLGIDNSALQGAPCWPACFRDLALPLLFSEVSSAQPWRTCSQADRSNGPSC